MTLGWGYQHKCWLIWTLLLNSEFSMGKLPDNPPHLWWGPTSLPSKPFFQDTLVHMKWDMLKYHCNQCNVHRQIKTHRRKHDLPSNLNWIEKNMVCFQILIELNFCICLLNSIQPLTWHLLKWYSGMSFSMWIMVSWTEQFAWKRGGSHHQERGALMLRFLVELNWEMMILCRASYRDFCMD